MPEQLAFSLSELPINTKKAVTLGETKILIVRTDDQAGRPTLFALEAECPHAKAPLEKGAVCDGKLVCPYHTGTFALATGKLLEPPPLRDLKRYAVRFEDDQIFVNPEPLVAPQAVPVGEGKHLVFAGAGAATAAALAFLRDAAFAGTVTVIDPDAEEPVDRTQLSKMSLSGKKGLETLPLFPAGEGFPLPVQRVREKLIALDAERRTLTLANGGELRFDALLLATGSQPKLPELPGIESSNVFTIRHPNDPRRMDPLLEAGRRAVLLGDSFIAFEAASALRERGLEVTVVARSGQPFAKKFGPEVAEALLNLHRGNGVRLVTNNEAVSIGDHSVELKSGEHLDADVVLVAIGVDPLTGYAPALARGKRDGFETDETLRVAPHVWVAGDIASVEGTRIEHWRLAQQHGRVAAAAMLADLTGGSSEPFDGVPLFWTFHFGKRLNYAGHADTWDRIEYEGDVRQLNFLAYYLTSDRVDAVLGCGHDTAIAALMEPLRSRRMSLPEARAVTSAATL